VRRVLLWITAAPRCHGGKAEEEQQEEDEEEEEGLGFAVEEL